MSKLEVLKGVTFGARVAEEEGEELEHYFVTTDQWQRVWEGEKDIIYGPKGSGKSAIYALVLKRRDALLERKIIIEPAENLVGTPVFKSILEEDDLSEDEFRNLWKVYFASVAANTLVRHCVAPKLTRQVIGPLRDAEVIPEEWSLLTLLKDAWDYVRSLRPKSVDAGVDLDPSTALVSGVSGKIVFEEPGREDRKLGKVSVNSLLSKVNDALAEDGFELWLALDRLDVAFATSPVKERAALRALFRVYRDLQDLNRIHLKIFLRSDIKARVFKDGFREASHITRDTNISWDASSLMNLVVRRMLRNDAIRSAFGIGCSVFGTTLTRPPA